MALAKSTAVPANNAPRPGGLKKSTAQPSAAPAGLRRAAAPEAAAAESSTKAPCAGCAKGLGLTVKAGTAAALRAQLFQALVTVSNFVLAFYDSAIVEAPPSAGEATSAPPSTERWSASGLTVDFAPDGPFAVTIEHDSPAYHSGIKAGDRIISLDDVDKIHHNLAFSSAWKLGERWPGGSRVVVERDGEHHPIQIAHT